MKYRYELKFNITDLMVAKIKAKLNPVLKRDTNDNGMGYCIRSLYFDDIYDSALKEKEDGIFKREKFRIRIYNGNSNIIYLEKKQKIGKMTNKTRVPLTYNQAQSLIEDDNNITFDKNNHLLNEFLYKKKSNYLQKKQLVEYNRHAYVYKFGNVRITIDSNLMAPLSLDLFDNKSRMVTVLENNMSVLEVKYDNFLPSHIAQLLQMDFGKPSDCSKYYLCRMASKKFGRF